MGSVQRKEVAKRDIIVIGAGISGIDIAYRVQTRLPNHSYAILEARESLGGTWDLFKYPGIRSDSDLYSFGYPWRPWREDKAIADGPSILRYINDSAAEFGIDKKVRFDHRMLSANWSSANRRWTIEVDVNGEVQEFECKFMFLSTGYYDYKEPQAVAVPGLETFKGDTIHPQFWPEGYDYSNKKVVIIGSGATAVTLLPTMAPTAGRVTMLQRTANYVMPLEAAASGTWIRKVVPARYADTVIRWKHILIAVTFYYICQWFPTLMKALVKRLTVSFLPKSVPYDPHFNPKYNIWDQRICFCPDGDFLLALHRDNTEVVTDTIKSVKENGILTSSGRFLEADLIVTATGLKIQVAGGARITVDGTEFVWGEKFIWNGAMVQDMPNVAYVIGYGNASWTLGADATGLLVTRLIKEMDERGAEVAVPRVEKDRKITRGPLLNLKSTYVQKAKDIMPQAGDQAPWHCRDNAMRDIWYAYFGDLSKSMEFLYKNGEKA